MQTMISARGVSKKYRLGGTELGYAVLRERIVEDADLVDAGVIFGAGFAPFRGGPIQYARTRGVDAIVGRLQELQKAHGDRFAPDAGWQLLR
jgi:3-hydroxyacyl-CoA dehydrogenase/enoyl-CoA hydratase/3-hydroxybutyryl-CoA epimerase